MKELIRRGESGGQVSDWNPSSDTVTAPSQQSFFVPHGLTLRQTINAGTTSVTIPAGIEWVYVVLAGPGGRGVSGGGGAGGIAWGWTLAQSTCVVGSGTTANSGYTRYGHIMAGQGGIVGTSNSFLGSGTRADQNVYTANMYGMPVGGFGSASTRNAGDGISGGGGSDSATANGWNGGSGMAGGGGGYGASGFVGGTGGTGFGIDGTVYTAGTAAGNRAGGGGAGIAGNGSNAAGTSTGGAGGLGGGGGGSGPTPGAGGDGILYIFY